jgi:hypothetical protein
MGIWLTDNADISTPPIESITQQSSEKNHHHDEDPTAVKLRYRSLLDRLCQEPGLRSRTQGWNQHGKRDVNVLSYTLPYCMHW